jgi:hypothetical protein
MDSELTGERADTTAAQVGDIFLRKENATKSSKNQNLDPKTGEIYVPINFIPDEAYALIAAFEASFVHEPIQADLMDIDTASLPSSNHLESGESCLNDPPKRYYRTFWKSASRRIIALKSIEARCSPDLAGKC